MSTYRDWSGKSPKTEKAKRRCALCSKNKLDDAQQYLVHERTIDPDFADGNYLMGLLLLRRKDSGRAVAYLQKSLKLSRTTPLCSPWVRPRECRERAMTTSKDMGARHFLVYFLVAGAKTMW
jgi:hypothetical protein